MNKPIEQLHKKLKLIYSTIFIVALLFSSLCFIAYKTKLINIIIPNQDVYFIKIIIYFVILAGIPLGYLIKQLIIKKTAAESDIERKIAIYFKIAIIRFALFEVLIFISSMVCLITKHTHLLIIWGISVILLMMNKPNKTKIQEELQINQDQL